MKKKVLPKQYLASMLLFLLSWWVPERSEHAHLFLSEINPSAYARPMSVESVAAPIGPLLESSRFEISDKYLTTGK